MGGVLPTPPEPPLPLPPPEPPEPPFVFGTSGAGSFPPLPPPAAVIVEKIELEPLLPQPLVG